MSLKRISVAVAAAALGAGLLTAFGTPAQADQTAPSAAAPTPIPEIATDELGFAQEGLEFGLLTDVRVKGGKLRVTLEPAEFYTGKAAKLLNGGITPMNDYELVEDETADAVTYVVSAKASLIAVNQLLPSPEEVERTSITAQDLVKNFKEQDVDRVPVWVRHADAPEFSGVVTALAEQYVP